MSTSTVIQDEHGNSFIPYDPGHVAVADKAQPESPTRTGLGRTALTLAGLLALLAAAWGGVVPYVGPLFGYSADGSRAWHWSMPHALLGLLPGLLGMALGLLVVAESRGITVGRGRLSLAGAGTLLMVCGAWFAIGPLAWPVVFTSSSGYYAATSHLGLLEYEVGYSIGTGLVLVICGAFVDGWASRHLPTAGRRVESEDTVESGI